MILIAMRVTIGEIAIAIATHIKRSRRSLGEAMASRPNLGFLALTLVFNRLYELKPQDIAEKFKLNFC